MDEIINETKEVKVEEIQKKINDILDLSEMEDLIKSNEKIFELNNVTYRVRKPNLKEKQEAYRKRVEKFTELLYDKKYKLEEDLKQVYLERGIDINAITLDIQNKMLKRDGLMVKLGEAIKNKAVEPDLLAYKEEITDITFQIQNLSIRKTGLLEYSIENQVMIYAYSYLTFLIAEKKEGEQWVRVWKDWSEFENDKEVLVNKFSMYVTLISNIEEI